MDYVAAMKAIADHYEAAPVHDLGAHESYRVFVAETDAQFAQLEKLVRVEFTFDDPYPAGSSALCSEIDGGTMRVYATPLAGPFHPILTPDENNRFRAVHDYFGHYVGLNAPRSCHTFGDKGEVNTFRAHSRMYSADALEAMASETIAQNAWFNFGPHSHLPRPARPFAAQKGVLTPRHLWEAIREGRV